jgi:hypothetical protein
VNAISIIAIVILAILITFGLHTESRQEDRPPTSSPPITATDSEGTPEVTLEPIPMAIITQTEAKNLVLDWHNATAEMVLPDSDQQRVAALSTEQFYQKIMQPRGLRDRLIRNQIYHQFDLPNRNTVRQFNHRNDQALIELWLIEKRIPIAVWLAEKSASDGDNGTGFEQSRVRQKLVRCHLERVEQQWKVADCRVIRRSAPPLIASTSINS